MYSCGGKLFYTEIEAVSYANFIAKVSRIILGVEFIKLERAE